MNTTSGRLASVSMLACTLAYALMAMLASGVSVAHAQSTPQIGSPPASTGGQDGRLLGGPVAGNAPYAEIGPTMNLSIGKSTLVRLPAPIERISVGDPSVADVTLISNRELYLLGKTFGSTNVIMWGRAGATTIVDVNVGVDAKSLEARMRELLPQETGIVVGTAADAVVLSGTVSSLLKADQAVSIAEAYARRIATSVATAGAAGATGATGTQAGGAGTMAAPRAAAGAGSQLRVVNMLRISSPQQVMLEVKVAEISKTLLDKLGASTDLSRSGNDWRYGLLTNFLTGSAGVLGVANRGNLVNLDAEKQDGLVRVLAEPNIVAISGQEASFLAGGRIFIPVSRANSTTGVPSITLEEREFGVGLRFTPTVLDGDLINLQVAPEVSELVKAENGATGILPSFTTRRAQTTVQLRDGQSFAIAGLIKNNMTETIRRFPVLGEVPILGALFRSSDFQTDQSELMFIITPRLVKPFAADAAVPTDHWIPPGRGEFFLNGRMEGSAAGQGQQGQRTHGSTGGATAVGGFQLRKEAQ
jgi:pilus assembly protein CpaC